MKTNKATITDSHGRDYLVKFEMVTPIIAMQYLATQGRNRRLNPSRVGNYSSDMATDNWEINGETIKFNEDGQLIDGQHRLNAIIKSGQATELLVICGINRNACNLDCNMTRSIGQMMYMGGCDEKALRNNTTIGAIKMVLNDGSSNFRYFTKSEMQKVADDYTESIINAYNIVTAKINTNPINCKNAALMAAILLALLNGESMEKLSDFTKILADGFAVNPKERAAIVCRNDLLSKKIDYKAGMSSRNKAMFQFEKAIFDFCRGVERKRSYESVNEHTYTNVIAEK